MSLKNKRFERGRNKVVKTVVAILVLGSTQWFGLMCCCVHGCEGTSMSNAHQSEMTVLFCLQETVCIMQHDLMRLRLRH